MLQKTYSANFKAETDAKGRLTGEVKAIVSVYGNVDHMGDVVVEGAFDENIEEWKASGDPIPVVWSHDWGNPMSHIGAWDPAKARNVKAGDVWPDSPPGLLLEGKIDVGTGNPIADQVAKLMAERRVKEFSFAYDVVEEGPSKSEATKGANELRALRIHEAGPTLKGANPATELIAAKAEELAKAGRVLSSKNESALREAAALIDGILSTLGDEPKARQKADDEEEAEEPTQCSDCGAPIDADGNYVPPASNEDLDEPKDDDEDLASDEDAEKEAELDALRLELALAD